MGKLTAFEITLNGPTDVFYAGQIIHGSVMVKLKEPMKMRGIFMTINGGARTRFRTTVGTGKRRRRRWCYGNEMYCNNKFPVYGKALTGKGEDVSELPTGQHVFPFQCELPPNLPSSFEGHYGCVRYNLVGNIDKPWKFDHTTVRMFTVICPLDLNLDPTLNQPASKQDTKTKCCCCCASGPITGTMSVSKRGYVPGEMVVYNASGINATKDQMRDTRIKFIMLTRFFDWRGRSAMWSEVVVNVQKPALVAGAEEQWSNESFQLPPLPPSHLLHCNIIRVEYYLLTEIDPGALSFNLRVPVELIVGTVPFRETFPQYWAQQMPSTDMGAPAPALPPPTFNAYSGGEADAGNPEADGGGDEGGEADPGSGDEGQGDGTNEHTMGNKDYKPVYPYFNYS